MESAGMETAEVRQSRKSNGVHYTPDRLAEFLARRLWFNASLRIGDRPDALTILDPACGDGQLLQALAERVTNRPTTLVGFETDAAAVLAAKARLASESNRMIDIRNEDFLDFALRQTNPGFDIVIANPPYVRTQVLGQLRSKQLASQFGLHGRVDLYQAFLFALTKVLKEGGWLGALTSNRFLYTQAGQSTRNLLATRYQIHELFDLGDTRLFEATVLPAVFVAQRSMADQAHQCQNNRLSPKFVRVERSPGKARPGTTKPTTTDLLSEIESRLGESSTRLVCQGREYLAESGGLKINGGAPWCLESTSNQQWLNHVIRKKRWSIGDIAKVKVGIKTTADHVFIRNDWQQLPVAARPEEELLRPLLTHQAARRWSGLPAVVRVLYPYENQRARTPIDLKHFPRGQVYLNQFRQRLAARKYLMNAGRCWFEIWVPHRPADWSVPKVVWPDISKEPKFFLDRDGCIVNGDCYWIKLKPGQPEEWLYLILAVANSQLALKFYDYRFHNKLYGQRRRFMSQYVKQFPLPDPDRSVSQTIIARVKQLLRDNEQSTRESVEAELEELVHQAFGLEYDSTESTSCP